MIKNLLAKYKQWQKKRQARHFAALDRESKRLDKELIVAKKRAQKRGYEKQHRPKPGTKSQSKSIFKGGGLGLTTPKSLGVWDSLNTGQDKKTIKKKTRRRYT